MASDSSERIFSIPFPVRYPCFGSLDQTIMWMWGWCFSSWKAAHQRKSPGGIFIAAASVCSSDISVLSSSTASSACLKEAVLRLESFASRWVICSSISSKLLEHASPRD